MRVLVHFYDEFYAIIIRFYIYSITYCIIDIFWVFRLLRIPSPRPKQPYHHWWYGCFWFYGLRRDSRNELPVKQGIGNALQGRDEQTHKLRVCGDRAQRKPHFARKAVLQEQNALPYETWIMENLTAKDDVGNVGAGRAAKGENPGRSFFAIPSLRSLLPRPKNAGNCLNFLHFLFVFQFPFLCLLGIKFWGVTVDFPSPYFYKALAIPFSLCYNKNTNQQRNLSSWRKRIQFLILKNG